MFSLSRVVFQVGQKTDLLRRRSGLLQRSLFSNGTAKASKGDGVKKGLLPVRLLHFLNRPVVRYSMRAVRTGVLIFGIAGAAYSYGQMELLDDPEGHQANMFYAVVSQNNSTNHFLSFYDKDNLYDLASNLKCKAYCYGIDSENRQYKRIAIKNSEPMWVHSFRVQKVFARVKQAALLMWEERVENLEKKIQRTKLQAKVAGKAPDDGSLNKLQEELRQVKVKRNALRKPWNLVMLRNENPNAFVHGFLPQKIFIHTGAMKYFVESDEELALLLGHELSHYLQGHTKTLMLESAVCKALVTVVMAMIDPSGGIGGFAIEMLLPWIDSLIMAANSRECESEADMVGLEIVSRACYNPSKAVKLFSNMKNFEAQFKPSKGYNMLATHPLSSEREVAACEASTRFHKLHYSASCSKTQSTFSSIFKA